MPRRKLPFCYRVRVRNLHRKNALERQIAGVDAQIDQLVFELYGLADEEICLVGEAAAR